MPYLLIIGDKEVENGLVAVRSRDGKDLGVMTIDAAYDMLQKEITERVRSE